MYIWVRDHRLHHKYSDTDADPHNANRGFFFSHMGWLMSRKHPAVIEKGKTIDMSDLEADFLVMFQKFFYKPMYVLFALAIPIAVPVYLWNENYYDALFVVYFARYILTLNITWLVNSAAHLYGTKPYDKNFGAVESWFVSFATVGEGWHNYHHAFPWDYRAGEYGTHYSLTTFIIDLLEKFGFVYDLKTTPGNMIEQRVYRTGDPSCKEKVQDGKIIDINGNEIDPKLQLKLKG
nr:acyl-CoA desaturase 2-like [Onthophagus taurus]XP_022904664.1 acyl-CoA desaturase 2-like [Onthophagus taurus]